VIGIVVLWAIILVLTLIRHELLDITFCSILYWVQDGLSVLTFMLLSYYLAFKSAYNQNDPNNSNDPNNPNNLNKFPPHERRGKIRVCLIPVYSLGAGILAGMLGIGGGMLMAPLFMELGMNNQVTASTCPVLVLMTTSTSAFQYVVFGSANMDYAAFYFVLGILASTLGQILVHYLVSAYKRTSLIVISIALVVGLATVLMSIIGVKNIIDDVRLGRSLGLKNLC